MRHRISLFVLGMLITALAAASGTAAVKLTSVEELGKKIFFDKNLSDPPGQSCAACHDPKAGWTGPLENLGGVYEGALKGRFGNRKPPSAAYAGRSPILRRDDEGQFEGGLFWDGRATGAALKDPLAEQAGGPFLNPLEHNMPDQKAVVLKIKASAYAARFAEIWKVQAGDWAKDADRLYECVGRSIAAFERSAEVNPFNSKFDAFWRRATAKKLDVEIIAGAGTAPYAGLGLDETELKGLALFAGKAKCAGCHLLTPGPGGEPPVFTDFKYENIGAPRNPANPFYRMDPKFNPAGSKWVDEGLGGYLKTTKAWAGQAAANIGRHKVPTLRNVDLKPEPRFVKVYTHNGAFKSLKEIVHFYNTSARGGFPPPEVGVNLNSMEMGALGLDESEENAVVAFLRTLSDGFAGGRM